MSEHLSEYLTEADSNYVKSVLEDPKTDNSIKRTMLKLITVLRDLEDSVYYLEREIEELDRLLNEGEQE